MTRKRRKSAQDPDTTAGTSAPRRQHDSGTSVLVGVVSCFVLSGFAALIYQTAWMRQFSLVFGTSELAVATVLSAYMGGLALGAAVAGRYVDRVLRPILVYGLLEAGIALSALAVPLLLRAASFLYVALMGNQTAPADASGAGQTVFYLVVTFITLAIPTTCMGATLPILTKYVVRSDEQIGPRVGMLYALNTVGAVGGTLVAAFWLLPAFGLSGTIGAAITVNVLIFAIASAIVRIAPATDRSASRSEPTIAGARGAIWILPLMLVSGANTFAYEVLWTRLLGHVLGGSIVSFAAMLASFLTGIALGSALAARLARDRSHAALGFILSQIGIAVTSMVIYQWLYTLAPTTPGLGGNVGLAIAILLPATLFIGATFPFAVRILTPSSAEAGHGSARVYAWNTIGAIVGAIAAGYLLIPLLRYEGTIRVAVTTNLVLAFVASLMIWKRRNLLSASVACLALIVLLVYRPEIPEKILRTSPISDVREGALRYYEVGRSATVIMLESDGFFNLRTNGLPEASTNLTGAPPYQHNQRLLSTLPVFARPDIKDMLVIGFGAGVALEAVPSSVESIDVIELEPRVIDANRSISGERQLDPLLDPRIHIYINDARSALALTSKRYDAIISQPSHPWTAGASHLYTREFMALAKDHLKPGGVFLQWMNTQFVTEPLLRSLCATMLDVYSHARIYQWNPEILFFLGSDDELEVERQLAQTGRPISDDPEAYFERGIGSLEDLLVALMMDERNMRRFAADAPVLTDNMNRLATDSAMAMQAGETLNFFQLVDLTLPFSPILQQDFWGYGQEAHEINFAYIAGRLERMGLKKNAIALSETLQRANSPQARLLIGLGLARQGESLESQRVLLSAHLEDTGNSQIQYAILRPWLNRLSRDDTPGYVTGIATKANPEVQAVLRAWQAAADMNWATVAALDNALATAKATDLWYLDAVKLRADWRMKVTTPELQPRLALQAQRLIDNAIAIHDDPEFYSMRVGAAYVADSPLDVVETTRRLVYIFNNELDNAEDGRVSVTADAIDLKIRQVDAARNIIDDIAARHADLPAYKTELLDNRLNLVADRLAVLKNRYR